jgi:hypothetical protein
VKKKKEEEEEKEEEEKEEEEWKRMKERRRRKASCYAIRPSYFIILKVAHRNILIQIPTNDATFILFLFSAKGTCCHVILFNSNMF